jgi:hypothetical protein
MPIPNPKAVLATEPANAAAHFELGDAYARAGAWIPAIAQYRSALALGARHPEAICQRISRSMEIAGRIPAAAGSHNGHFRIQWLARHIRGLFPGGGYSLLDAGGGDGRLATVLPEVEYVLAEPATNGIFVTPQLSFNRKFDCVVCCHVLEHIPIEMRDTFLDALCGMANQYVLLLNPVADSHTDLRRWQELIFEITGETWAKEHIDCVMPRLEDITGYAERRGYSYRVKPNGSKVLSLAIVFMDHYARFGKPAEVAKINQMFNSLALDDLDHAAWPNAFLVEICTTRSTS